MKRLMFILLTILLSISVYAQQRSIVGFLNNTNNLWVATVTNTDNISWFPTYGAFFYDTKIKGTNSFVVDYVSFPNGVDVEIKSKEHRIFFHKNDGTNAAFILWYDYDYTNSIRLGPVATNFVYYNTSGFTNFPPRQPQ